MNKEYYTPEISDLKIGYECEICTNYGYESFNEGEEKWEKVIIGYKIPGGYNDELCDIIHGLDDGYQPVRVKYLIKEQIENEGWKYKDKSIDIWFNKDGIFDMGSWTAYKAKLQYGLHDKRLRLFVIDTDGIEYNLFIGKCPSINEFRYICKLLNI